MTASVRLAAIASGNTDSEGKGLSQGSHGRDRWLAGRSSGPDPPLQFGHPVNP
jgi:hypothetical protein